MSPVPAAVWRRALRVTITASVVFYGCRYGLDNPTASVYAVFAVLAFALLSEATGRPAQRTRTLAVCLGVGLVVVTIATYVAVTTWLAVLAMFVAGFAVSFAAVGGVRVVEVSTGLQLLRPGPRWRRPWWTRPGPRWRRPRRPTARRSVPAWRRPPANPATRGVPSHAARRRGVGLVVVARRRPRPTRPGQRPGAGRRALTRTCPSY